ERTVAFLDHAAPRAEVHFVDGHRAAEDILRPPAFHPLLVSPEIAVELVDHGSGRRRHFGAERIWIRFQQARAAVAGADLVLVAGAGSDVRDEQLPDSGRADAAHLVQPPVPGIEIADYGHRARRRRPDRERRPEYALGMARVRAEALPDALVTPFRDQVGIELAEGGEEAVRITQREARATAIVDLQKVTEDLLAAVQASLEYPTLPVARGHFASEVRQDGDAFRVRAKRADHDAIAVGMDPEHRMRIRMSQLHQALDLEVRLRQVRGSSHASSRSRSRAGIPTQSGR